MHRNSRVTINLDGMAMTLEKMSKFGCQNPRISVNVFRVNRKRTEQWANMEKDTNDNDASRYDVIPIWITRQDKKGGTRQFVLIKSLSRLLFTQADKKGWKAYYCNQI